LLPPERQDAKPAVRDEPGDRKDHLLCVRVLVHLHKDLIPEVRVKANKRRFLQRCHGAQRSGKRSGGGTDRPAQSEGKRTLPLTVSEIGRAGAPSLVSRVISSGVTIAGPMGANVSKDLPICTGTGGHSG
jgi:hypothetical protein